MKKDLNSSFIFTIILYLCYGEKGITNNINIVLSGAKLQLHCYIC